MKYSIFFMILYAILLILPVHASSPNTISTVPQIPTYFEDVMFSYYPDSYGNGTNYSVSYSLFINGVLNLTGSVGNISNYCYHETATDLDCGSSAAGGYKLVNTISGSNMYDEDYDTFGFTSGNGGLYVNYTIPINTIQAYAQHKHNRPSGLSMLNTSISPYCLQGPKLQLYYNMVSGTPANYYLKCYFYNVGSFQTIYSITCDDCEELYEEAIFWNIIDYSLFENSTYNIFNLSALSVNEYDIVNLSASSYYNNTLINSSTLNFTSSSAYLVECGDYTITSLNTTFYSEGTTNRDDVNYSTYINYAHSSGVSNNYSASADNTNNFTLCIYPPHINLTIQGLIDYDSFAYNIYEMTVNNITQHLSLYTQSTTETTSVTFTVVDYNTNDVEDAYIHIIKWDPGTNSYTTTEILRTDASGQAVGEIILGTEYYRFIVQYNGLTKLIEPETQGVRVYSTTRTFRISLDDQEWYEDYDAVNGITTEFKFNESGTDSFVFDWSNPTSTIVRGCLEVVKRNASGSFNVFNSCSSSASASIVASPTLNDCGSYIGTAYFDYSNTLYPVKDSPTEVKVLCEYSFADVKGHDGGIESVFYAWILIGTLAMVGIMMPELALILVCVGLLATVIMGLLQLAIPLVVGFCIVSIILIWKYNRK